MTPSEAGRKARRRVKLEGSESGTLRFKNRLADWGIPEEIVEDFAERHTRLNYPKGAVIFPLGVPGEFLAWVRSGAVETALREVNGRRLVTRLAGPGDVFGHEGLVAFNANPAHGFESRAHTDCQVALVSHARVVEALQTLPPAALVRLVQKVATAWAKAEQYWARFIILGHRQRLETIFADLATRFGAPGPRGTVMTIELGHYDLARMIGCSRPMVSQLIGTMVRTRNVLRSDGRYVIPSGSSGPRNRRAEATRSIAGSRARRRPPNNSLA